MSICWPLSYARGYIELEMFTEAEHELSQLDDALQEDELTLHIYSELYHGTEDWKGLRAVAEKLTQLYPTSPSGWISFAFAVRRMENITNARTILLEAEKLHGKEPTIKFNLGCYAAIEGNLKQAQKYVNDAILLDEAFKELAAEDPDLEPLREEGLI